MNPKDGTPNLIYTFTRRGVTSGSLTVNFTVGGTATLTTDYAQTGASSFSATSGKAQFSSGQTTKTVTINPKSDATIEPDETVVLTMAAGTGYAIGAVNSATGTIANDDPRVILTVTPSSVAENGTSNIVYTFTRTGSTTSALNANFSVGGTATLGGDYATNGATSFSETSGTVTFAAGQSTKKVTIDPTGDTTLESNETVALTVIAGSGYVVGTTSAVTSTINNDDTEVSVSVSPSTVTENGTPNLVYAFTRAGVTSGSLTVSFTVGGTATFSSDYTQTGAATFTATTGTLSFSAGQTTKTITINPKGDSTIESDETVTLTIRPGTTYSLGTGNSATGTIANDDSASLQLIQAFADDLEKLMDDLQERRWHTQ